MLVLEGNAFYEIDEECLRRKEEAGKSCEREKESAGDEKKASQRENTRKA